MFFKTTRLASKHYLQPFTWNVRIHIRKCQREMLKLSLNEDLNNMKKCLFFFKLLPFFRMEIFGDSLPDMIYYHHVLNTTIF